MLELIFHILDYFFWLILVIYQSIILDSLCYEIRTEDVYDDMQTMKGLFDTSNYQPNHNLFSSTNKKVRGKFKDELESEFLTFHSTCFFQTLMVI